MTLPYPIEDYAATVCANAPLPCDEGVILRELTLANAVDQLRLFPGGFVAWLRCSWDSLRLFENWDSEGVSNLSVRELTTGPVLYVAEIVSLKPGESKSVVRQLGQLPGVEALAGHRAKFKRWTVRRVRRRIT